jgi:hypothetical protein
MGASVFVAKRGGTIVTCAATSGYMIEYDNRHLWMKLKRIISSHFANYAEAWAANRSSPGRSSRCCRPTYDLDRGRRGRAAVHHNEAEGKIGVLCLAPTEGLGIDDPEKRERIGEDKITGVDPADCVAIEDSPTGVASALAAGCATLGVPHVVPIAAAPGLTLVDSLVGLRVADLRELCAR